MNNKLKVWLICLGGLLINIFFWLIADSYAEWSVKAPIILVFLSYYALNILNWGVITGFYFWKKWRGVLAGFLVTIWWEIVSLPHAVSFSGKLPVDSQLYSTLDVLTMRMLPFLNGRIGIVFLYVIFPILFLFLSSKLLFPNEFVKLFQKQIKGGV